MTLKGMVDRKLVMLVVSPLLRRVGTVIATYLISTGLPSDEVGRLLTALSGVLAVAVDLAFAAWATKSAEKRGARNMLDAIERTDTDVNWEPSK